MKLRTVLFSVFLTCCMGNWVQAQIPKGILENPKQFAEADTTEREVIFIEPWKKQALYGYNIVTNDSLLRWENWAQWGDFIAYQPNVIAFRQGSNGRVDAFDINGYGPLEQRVNVNGISLNNAITGLVNYNFIPAYKVSEMWTQYSGSFNAEVRLKDYYIVKPLSYLTFDEADFNYRNLEFMVTQNFSEKTNVELSFWDRRDGGGYPRNEIQGSQIMFKGYHFLNQNLQIRAVVMRNQYERDEPFGYVIGDPLTFAHSEFSSQANKSGIKSNVLRRDVKIGVYTRPDSLASQDLGLELYHTKNEFDLPFDSDTLAWDLRTWRLRGITSTSFGRFEANGSAQIQTNYTKSLRGLSKDSWHQLDLELNVEMPVTDKINLFSNNSFSHRFDGYQGVNVSGGTNIILDKLNLNLETAYFQRMPTIQQLYWTTADFSGNPHLKEIKGISFSPALRFNLTNSLSTGVSGRFTLLDNDVFIGTDSTFVNSSNYPKISGTFFGEFHNQPFELHSSATVDALTAVDPNSVIEANNRPDRKIWLRNNVFLKGYMFERAAYVKAGLLTTLSPLPYRSRLFNTGLQYWENAALEESEIPAFFRMDAEISARVRSMMVLIRWENVLDGFGQAGYFEAATLPMPARRLIVGIRAQFRN